MTKPYRITVDQAAIKADEPALHVHHIPSDRRSTVAGPLILHNATLIQAAEALADGARVWIECDGIEDA